MATPSSLPLGAHRIAVYAADGTLLGWQSVTVATATPTNPADPVGDSSQGGSSSQDGDLATTGGAIGMSILIAAGAAALIGAGLWLARRRRTVS